MPSSRERRCRFEDCGSDLRLVADPSDCERPALARYLAWVARRLDLERCRLRRATGGVLQEAIQSLGLFGEYGPETLTRTTLALCHVARRWVIANAWESALSTVADQECQVSTFGPCLVREAASSLQKHQPFVDETDSVQDGPIREIGFPSRIGLLPCLDLAGSSGLSGSGMPLG